MRRFISVWLPLSAILLLADGRPKDLYSQYKSLNNTIYLANHTRKIDHGWVRNAHRVSRYYFEFIKYTSKEISKMERENVFVTQTKPGEIKNVVRIAREVKHIVRETNNATMDHNDATIYECAVKNPLPDELKVFDVKYAYCGKDINRYDPKLVYGANEDYDGNLYGFVNKSTKEFTREVFVTRKVPLRRNEGKCCYISVVSREQNDKEMIRWRIIFVIRRVDANADEDEVRVHFEKPFRVVALKVSGEIKKDVDEVLELDEEVNIQSSQVRGILCIPLEEVENTIVDQIVTYIAPFFPSDETIQDNPAEQFQESSGKYTRVLYVTTSKVAQAKYAKCIFIFRPHQMSKDTRAPYIDFLQQLQL